MARNGQQGMRAKEPMPGPHACTAAPTACGQRTLTACPKDREPGQGECLTPDAPDKGTRHPPRKCPPATPRARKASSQGRALLGVCRAPIPAPPAPQEQGQQTPTACPKDGHLEEGECLIPDAPHYGVRSLPPGNIQPAPWHVMSSRACKPWGQCRIPTPAHPHPQHVGSGPRLFAPRRRGRGRVSA